MDTTKNRTVYAIAQLAEPIRNKIFTYVQEQSDAVTTDQVAKALSMARGTASFHLEKLAESGLLNSEFRRLSGKTGPGAGRPNKLYSINQNEMQISIPARRYDLAAEIFLQAIDQVEESGRNIDVALAETAHAIGKQIGSETTSLEEALEASGYRPHEEVDKDDNTTIQLKNCPFHQLSQRHTERVCRTNLALIEGITEALPNNSQCSAIFAPGQGPCCVYIETAKE